MLITTPADRLLNFDDQSHIYNEIGGEREIEIERPTYRMCNTHCVNAFELKPKVNCSMN